MDPDRWSRVERLYHEAAKLEAADREAFLARACAGDRSLLTEITSLLAEDDCDGPSFEEPALEVAVQLVVGEIPLLTGRTFGPYRIDELLGTGGMGDVYRARDTILGRDVAIKILPEAFNDDPERLARFEQEAQFLALLSHPNIAAIYGVHVEDRLRGLVLELVDGETLAARLRRGPLAFYEAARIARQVGEGLDAAHQRGIVHRDLKPSNIKIARDGTAKVLDFGLARSESVASDGIVAGTASYMSPEQARGEAVDKRTDIWAFGCVVFEMLTGQPAFRPGAASEGGPRESAANWNLMPAGVPAGVVALLKRCLDADLKCRRRDIGDVLVDLDAASSPEARTARVSSLSTWLVSAGTLLMVSAVALLIARTIRPAVEPQSRAQARLSLLLPSGMDFPSEAVNQLAVSPDGTMIAYVANSAGQAPRLLLRRLDASSERVIDDALDVRDPFFSPDSRWLGFFAGDTIRKVSIADGRSHVVGQAPRGESASWDHGFIMFGEAGDRPAAGVRRMSEDGGPGVVVSTPDREAGEINHLAPQLLPDGRTIIYTVRSSYVASGATSRIMVKTPGSPARVLVDEARLGRYVGNSVLLYQRNRSLMATTLDLQTLTTAEPGVMLFDDLSPTAPSWAAGGGVLVYRPRNDNRRFVWVGRDGTEVSLPGAPKRYAAPSLSPRGDRIAVEIEDDGFDVWVLDIQRQSLSKLTSDGASRYPMWTPDGAHVGVVQRRDYTLYWKAPGESASHELVRAQSDIWIGSWSSDMRTLIYMLESPGTGSDLWAIDLQTNATHPLVQTPAREYGGRVSPDGRWLAYFSNEPRPFSNEPGPFELYLRPLARSTPRYRISTTGERSLARAREAVWARDGRELFYRHGSQMMSVRLARGDGPPAPATVLFEGDYFAIGGPGIVNYDVSTDGRFLMLKAVEERTPHLNVVQGLDRLIAERLSPVGGIQ